MPREPKVDADAVVAALRDGPRDFAAPPELAEALEVTPQTIRNNHDRIIDDPRIDITKISRSTVYYLPEEGEPNIMEQSGGGGPPHRDFRDADELEAENWVGIDLSDEEEAWLESYAKENGIPVGEALNEALWEFFAREEATSTDAPEANHSANQIIGVSIMLSWVSIAVAGAAFVAALLSLAPAASFVAGMTSVAAVAAAVFTLALVKVPRFRELVVGFSTSSVERGDVDA